MKTRILKIKGHKIHYTRNECISFLCSNFPSLEDFKFKSHTEILWEVEIKKYDAKSKILFVKIINYQSNKIDSFKNQSKKNKDLKKIFFDYMLWDKLEPQFMYYKKSSFKEIVDHESFNKSNNHIYHDNNTLRSIEIKDSDSNLTSENQLSTIIEDFHTKIYFKDAVFLDGSVKFIFNKKELSEKIELEIHNSEIKKEFDFIKYHFQKVFKRKTFDVYGTKTSTILETKFENLTSPQIDTINSSIVEQIKLKQYRKITKITYKDNSKKLLDVNDIFNELSLNKKSGLFNESEKDLIKFFLKDKTIRNKQQLVYLSGLKQSGSNNIKFSLNPHFGFLFAIKGICNIHYCWELLNSHATYLWSIPISTENKFGIIEKNIGLITEIGRRKYKENLNQEKFSFHNNISNFKLIRHTNSKNGFSEWKSTLNQYTT
jgi:hypothetical protein